MCFVYHLVYSSLNLNFFNSSRAARSFLGRRDHQEVRTSYVIMMTFFFQLIMFILFVILVFMIFAKNCCHISYVRFDLDLSLSCHKPSCDPPMSLLLDDLSKLLVLTSISCLIMTNPCVFLLTISDFTLPYFLRKIIDLFFDINTKFHYYFY